MAAAGRMLDDIQLVGIFVEGERGDRGAVAPLQIVPGPALPPGLVEKVGVVADHGAFHRAHAGLLHLLRKQIEGHHHLERALGLRGFLGRDFAGLSSTRQSCGWRSCLRWPRAGSGIRLCRWGGSGLHIGIGAGADGGIADAHYDDVAVQCAARVYIAIGHYERGPGEGFHGQERVGGRGGGELGVGGGRK